jgi:hypothetical protein
MDDSSQIQIPASFIAMFTPAGKTRPAATHAHMAQRYELCEDMAQMLSETAAEQQFKTGAAPQALLEWMERSLRGEGAVLEDAEAHWVVLRIAELLHWDVPALQVFKAAPGS